MINTKQKDKSVFPRLFFFANASKILILFRYCSHTLRSLILYIHSAPLAHSPHPLRSTHSFSTSIPLRLLIFNIHSAPLAHSPHQFHPLIDSTRQRRKNAHETESPYQLHPHSSCLQVQVSTLCYTSKKTSMCMLWCVLCT